MNLEELKRELKGLGNAKRVEISARFFKTGVGEYGHGDAFLGIVVPAQRRVAHKFVALPLSAVTELLKSNFHEHRFVALEILVKKYEDGDAKVKKEIVGFYLEHTRYINNWDLVDTSAEYILGDYLFDKNKDVLLALAKSKNVWERRIAIIATFNFIKKNRFDQILKIAETLLDDSHDLIHKAAGWMLREVGKRSLETELGFLDKYHSKMPRTMLRYAIEKFMPEMKRRFLAR